MNRTAYVLIAAVCLATFSVDAKKPGKDRATLGDLDCDANQIAKYDGEEWECAIDETSGSNQKQILVDSNGVRMGDVQGVSPDGNAAWITTEIGGAVVKLEATAFQGFPSRDAYYYYESADCTGKGYFPAPNVEPPEDIWLDLLGHWNVSPFREVDGAGNQIGPPIVYVAPIGSVPMTIAEASTGNAYNCTPSDPAIDRLGYDPGSLDSLDVSQFVAPFRIVAE